jgi:hypothetical protein
MAPRIVLAALAMAFVIAAVAATVTTVRPTDVAFCRRPILRGDKDQ